MRWSVPTDAQASPEFQFRRHALLVILGCVMITSVVSLGLSSLWAFGTFDQLGLAALTAKNVVLFVWLWLRPRAFRAVGVAEIVFEGLGGIYKFGAMLLVDHTSAGLGGYTPWLILYYLVASLVFRGRTALLVSLALYVPLLVLGAAYGLAGDIPLAVKRLHGNTLIQLYLLHGTLIAFLTLQDVLLRQYLHTLLRAEREARLANVDLLTGLANRRQLEAWLHERCGEVGGQAGPGAEPLSVILFDLDHFKRVNDTHGHDAGDRVLRATAAAARRALRGDDQLGRWGGEEFLVILPDSDGAQAGQVAERIQAAVATVRDAQVGPVTVSCGVAQARPAESLAHLLRRADEALYAAKRQGRDLVRVAS